MTLDSFISRVSNLSAEKLIAQAASLRKEELADLNVIQLSEGKLSTGQNISPNYESDDYAKFKKSIGSKSSPIPDLILTGAFTEGINVDIQGNRILFDSSDEKTNHLESKYSFDIFGVTDKNLIETLDADIAKIIDNEISE